MAKAPTVIGVLTEPTPPTWWQANRHKVLAIAGLLIGLYVGTHQDGTHQPSRAPHPGHTRPTPSTPGPSSTNTAPDTQPDTGHASAGGAGRITIGIFSSNR
ncbi:hypothetical protein ACIRVK_03725 [Streptomyces sp. NPDC101152]|uniref:hypothetical protein n=1 Tax=Streptomyces sp. NPDC101152 TaxID=3366116 RepID=UPI003807E088